MDWIKRGAGRLTLAAALALSAASCEFVSPTESDPNAIPDATVDQLFAGIQVKSYFYATGQLNRVTSLWMRQMNGTDRQFVTLDRYILSESDANVEFSGLYTGGGLIDLKRAISLAEEAGRQPYAGILKIHQAWLFGMAASMWGDIPYSEAANPEISQPSLDSQAEVYAAVQSLLDQAIQDLQGAGLGPGAVDLNFGGNTAAWTQVANSLKARFHLHWAEAEGSSRYQAALAAAQNGINDPANNWTAIFSSASTEANLWHQFQRDRSGYISGGHLGVETLKQRNDPRLQIYYTEASTDCPDGSDYCGAQVGSPPGDPGQAASNLNVPGQPDYDQPIITCAETQFIAAEAALALGQDPAPFFSAGVACQEANWGITIPNPGAPTLENIITEKYIANFLSMENFNDWKRTCLPVLSPHPAGVQPLPPGRFFYGQNERETNEQIPSASQQPARNANDPAGC